MAAPAPASASSPVVARRSPPTPPAGVPAHAVNRDASRNGTQAWRTWRSSLGMKGRAVLVGATKVADRVARDACPHPDPPPQAEEGGKPEHAAATRPAR